MVRILCIFSIFLLYVFSRHSGYWRYNLKFDSVRVEQVNYSPDGTLFAMADDDTCIFLYQYNDDGVHRFGNVSVTALPYIIGINHHHNSVLFQDYDNQKSGNVIRSVNFSKRVHGTFPETVHPVGERCIGYKESRKTMSMLKNGIFLCYEWDRDGENRYDAFALYDFHHPISSSSTIMDADPYKKSFDISNIILQYGDVLYLDFDHHYTGSGMRVLAYVIQGSDYEHHNLLRLTFDVSERDWKLLSTQTYGDFDPPKTTLVFEHGDKIAFALMEDQAEKVYIFNNKLTLLSIVDYSSNSNSESIDRRPCDVKFLSVNGEYYLADFSASPSPDPPSTTTYDNGAAVSTNSAARANAYYYDTSFNFYQLKWNQSHLLEPHLIISFSGEQRVESSFDDFGWLNVQFDPYARTFRSFYWIALDDASASFQAFRYGYHKTYWGGIILALVLVFLVILAVVAIISSWCVIFWVRKKNRGAETVSSGEPINATADDRTPLLHDNQEEE